MSPLHRILMKRDSLTLDEVEEIIQEAVDENPTDPEAALYDLGLEPDFLFDILNYY